MKTTALALFAVTLFALPLAAADVSGSWTLNGDVVGNPVNMKCNFKQTGTNIAGTCSGDAGSIQTTGAVTGDSVSFGHSVQSYDLTYTGKLDAAGTTMQGDIAVAGVTGTFSAKKDETSKPADPKPAAGPDVAGNWTINGEVVGNIINMKCALKRDGDKLSGNCNYAGLGDSPTTGVVAGEKLTLQNQVTREQLYDLTYNGTLDAAGASVKGDIAVAGVSGTFSGTKDK